MDESQTIRVSVEEAATLLGIEKASVKKRVQRGKLRFEKDAGGTFWVYLDRSETVRDQSRRRSETDRDELVGELRDRVRSLEGRLDEEMESRRRADTIIAQLTQANTTFSERLQELEASPEERYPIAEVSAQEGSDTWWEKTAKSTLPSVAGPLATAVISGLITLLATIEGATVVALSGFAAVILSVLGLVVGFYYGGQTAAQQSTITATTAAKAAGQSAARAAAEAAREAAEPSTRSDEDRPPAEDENMPEPPSAQDTQHKPRQDG